LGILFKKHLLIGVDKEFISKADFEKKVTSWKIKNNK
jgi:hypothetical protein